MPLPLKHGIYRIRHSRLPVALHLQDGVRVAAWEDNGDWRQLWIFEPAEGEADTYCLRNLFGGKYLDLDLSKTNASEQLSCHSRSGDQQKWIIKLASGGAYYKIQSKVTKNFLDLWGGLTANGSGIECLSGDWSSGTSIHKEWSILLTSLTAAEVHAALKNSACGDFVNYSGRDGGLYLPMHPDKLTHIWQKHSGLQNTASRGQIFEYDDYALVYKAAVSKYVRDKCLADGFVPLLGTMIGTENEKMAAYHWTILPDDLTEIRYFDPYTGFFTNYPMLHHASLKFF